MAGVNNKQQACGMMQMECTNTRLSPTNTWLWKGSVNCSNTTTPSYMLLNFFSKHVPIG